MNAKTPKGNGSLAPSSPSASSAQRSRLRRTLLGAAIGALIAMLFVPVVQYGGYGRTLAERRIYGHYQLLISAAGNNINTPQLLVNVAFLALLGALCANMSKRVALWTGGSAALVTAAWFTYDAWDKNAREACYRADWDEKYADELMSYAFQRQTSDYVRVHYSAQEIAHQIAAFRARAKEKRLLAADNWHIALDFVKEKRAREKAEFSPPPIDLSGLRPVSYGSF